VIEKELFPADVTVTSSEPDVAVEDVQLAEQEEVLVDDQVKVEVSPNRAEVGSADKLTVGAGTAGVAEPPPPPPPPPQETINKILKGIDRNFIFNLIYFNLCSKLSHIKIISTHNRINFRISLFIKW